MGAMKTTTTIRQGTLEGREKDGVVLLAGIPYAAPPVGDLRFRAPEPHPPWSGKRAAKRFGPASPQVPRGGLTDNAPVRWDEDCLTLNVCTPALDEARRPVLVWIHGGGFRSGQGGIPWYNGTSFARRGDIVTVSINYRLGALGFAHLAELGGRDYASSGLNGLLDQIAALEWVRDNIASFGGDPGNVTIAGESAGAMSVGTLLGCPAARGLFRRAIPQSGAAHNLSSTDTAGAVARQLMKIAGIEKIEELIGLPVEQLLDAQVRLEDELGKGSGGIGAPSGTGGLPFAPTVEGRVLPQSPRKAIGAGSTRGIDILIGTNRDETSLFGFGGEDEERLRKIAGRYFDDPEAALASYRAERPDAGPGDLVVALTTDFMFRIPALRLAEAHAANGGSPYVYLFSWESRAFGGRLKATHALEIPFVFNNLERAGVDTFLGPGPRPDELALTMHDAWISFIRSGEPGRDDWQPYTPERRTVLEFGETVTARDDPFGRSRELWSDRR